MRIPRISVLLSVYNDELYLKEAVESVLKQTFPDFEFIIVDDGSNDSTAAILNSFNDNRIVRIKNEKNIGLVKSLNRGLDVAKGEFIARMDADDISLPNRFLKQIEYLEKNHEVGVLGTQMKQIDKNGNFIELLIPPSTHDLIVWKMLFGCSIYHATVMMRRDLVINVGGYDPSYKHIEDTELWSRLINVTRFANLQEPLFIRRWHADSICNLHADTQYQVGSIIRHRLFESIIKKEVSKEVVEMLSNCLNYPKKSFENDQIKAIISVLIDLHSAFVKDNLLDNDTAKAIKDDLINRILFISKRNANAVNIINNFGKLIPYPIKQIIKRITKKI